MWSRVSGVQLCVAIYSNNNYILLMDSVGLEFGQGIMGMARLCSMMSEALAGKT